MPFRDYALDPGFDVPTQSYEIPPQPEERGGGLFQFGANWNNMVEDLGNIPKVVTSAFELENDVVNTIRLLGAKSYPRDPNFNLEANLKEAGLWDEYRWNFIGVNSAGEFLDKARQIQRENDAREVLRAAGPDGVVASMAAGLISPTTLLPFVGAGAKGWKAVGLGLAWGGLGGALQEVPLQLNQELRTLEESATSVAFSTIVGGVLGGGIGYLNKSLDDVAADMAVRSDRKTISPSEERVLVQRRLTELNTEIAKPKAETDLGGLVDEVSQLERRLSDLDFKERGVNLAKETDDAISGSALGKAAAGADVPTGGAGGLKNMLGIGERLTTLAGPVTAALGQKVSSVGRRVMAELSTAGLRLEGNSILDREGNIIGGIPSNSGGGTVEGLINSRKGDTLGLVDEAYKTYSDYMFGAEGGQGVFRDSRAWAKGMTKGKSEGKLNRRQFFEEVGKAMWQGDKHAIPEVQKVAESFRKYYDDLLKEAQDLEIIPKDIEAVAPDLSFLNRVYDTAAIARNPQRFKKLLADHFEQSLSNDLVKIHQQFAKGEARDLQRLADMDLPLEKAQALRQEFLDELKALNEADDDELKGIEDLISAKRSELADNTRARKKAEAAAENGTTSQRRASKAVIQRLDDERTAIRQKIDELRDLGGEDLETRRLYKAGLKMRIRNLNRSRFMVEEKARKKYDAIDKLEEDSIDALERLMAQGHRALKRGENEADAFERDWRGMQTALKAAQSKTAGYEAQVEALQDAVAAEKAASVPKLPNAPTSIEDLKPYTEPNQNGVPVEDAVTSPIPFREYPYELAVPKKAKDADRLITAKNAAYNAAEEVTVPIASLVTDNRAVGRSKIRNPSKDLPFVEDIGGVLHLRDGNHRVTAAILRGDTTIKVKVADMNQAYGTNAPVDAGAFTESAILQKLFKKEAQTQKAVDRFNELADDLESFENINFAEGGRRDAEALIREAITEAAERANRFNTRRAQRIKKLEDQIEKIDAKGWEARRAEIEQRLKQRRADTEERVRNLGGEKYDPVKGTADFKDRAKEIADLAEERISGTNLRLAGFDAMADARGTELARTLSIDSMTLAREGFLVSDAEHLLQVYANTLIPDIELVRRLGPFAPDGARNFNFQELNREMDTVLEQHKLAAEAKGVSAEKIGDEQQKLRREFDVTRKNLDAVIRRLRNQYGMPSDPQAFHVRAASTALALQAWRFLGGVTVSSISDLARPIMKYGLLRTLRNGWLPMVANWKAMKLTAADARRAYVAVESATADRAFQLTDLLDYARRKTKFEAGLQQATSKIGIIFGFAPWTDLMKTISAATFNSKLMDSIDLSLNSVKTSKDRLEAVDFLNSLGLSQDYQRRIWNEMQNGGAQQINGTWVPETAKWTDKAAIRAYRAAVNNETSATIITPGVELPKWSNAGPMWRLLSNLKSYALASTSKTLMAGLQQRDMAFFTGATISLALGALSFYLRSVIAGGATEERMRNATPEQWVDEALDASGLLGALSIVQQIGDNIPVARNVMRPGALASTLQGKAAAGTVRSQASGLIEDTFGPSANLIFTTAQILSGLDKPDRAQIHRVRQLLPMQNFILLRRLFDQVENSVGDSINATGQRR